MAIKAWLRPDASRDASVSAFAELSEPLYEPIFRFLARQTRREAEAADLTQETFIRAFRSFTKFDRRRAFAPWLYTIARRTLADHYRRSRPTEESLQDHQVDDQPTPDEAARSSETADRLWSEAKKLKPRLHQALLLHYAEGFSLHETARVMGISQTHVKVLLFRARQALKQRLGDWNPNPQST
jgi:RNA polymerase sigma-70 factor (ECF subfamily)